MTGTGWKKLGWKKLGWITIIVTVIFILVSVTATSILLLFSSTNERITGANSVGDDRIFRNGMTVNEAMSEMKWNQINAGGRDISNSDTLYYDPKNYDVQYHASYDGTDNGEVKESPKSLPRMDVSGRDISGISIPYYHTVSYERLDGYVLNSPNILPLTKYDTKYNIPYYDPNNYDVQYHSMYEGNGNTSKESGIWVKNPAGKLEFLLWTDVSNYSTYYKPGAFKYGPSNYVPSYEDTVYFKEYSDKDVVKYQK